VFKIFKKVKSESDGWLSAGTPISLLKLSIFFPVNIETILVF